MKNKKNEIEKVCAYCEHAASLKDKDFMLCGARGVVSASFSCRKFLYDPLKRIPMRATALPLSKTEEE